MRSVPSVWCCIALSPLRSACHSWVSLKNYFPLAWSPSLVHCNIFYLECPVAWTFVLLPHWLSSNWTMDCSMRQLVMWWASTASIPIEYWIVRLFCHEFWTVVVHAVYGIPCHRETFQCRSFVLHTVCGKKKLTGKLNRFQIVEVRALNDAPEHIFLQIMGVLQCFNSWVKANSAHQLHESYESAAGVSLSIWILIGA